MTQGRTVLDRVLAGRIVFTPTDDGTGYTFEAPTRFDKLFAGVAVPVPAWLPTGDRRGTEHLGPDDTFEGDYGRLLDTVVNRSVVASPRGDNRFFSRGPRRSLRDAA